MIVDAEDTFTAMLEKPLSSLDTDVGSVMYKGRVTDATAWRRQDLQDRRWLLEIPESAIGELETAAAAAADNGLRLENVQTSANAADPWIFGAGRPHAVEDLVARLRVLLERGPGFALLRRLPVERYTNDEAALVYWSLMRRLGRVVPQNSRGELLCEVRDYGRGAVSSGATVRGYQSTEALPFHTDSPDIVGLLCLHHSKSGGESAVASSMSIYNEIVEQYPEYLSTYYTGVYYDWRGDQPHGQPPVYRNPIYGYFDGQVSCRYYLRQFAESAGQYGFPLAPVEREALDLFESLAGREENHLTMGFKPGEMQFVNDNIVLHARSAYRDATDAPPRCLLRIWVNPPNGRIFPSYFARTRDGLAARGQT